LIHFEISGGTGAGHPPTILPVSACAEGLHFDAYLAGEPLRKALGDIVAPTRAISLEDDGFLTADAALHIAANVPGARLLLYPDCSLPELSLSLP